ncbi:uncharacterized protein BYT42DRAFT_497603 [Radiomyces spectabilis]|uniref:uncharacterized protein n=1 Tax=Radiomyces spectabilis TaxID=64574 RepID=UPI00221F0095|nr:uncharacterized protein BYT42DRAFT_497603 [Radiomyces spectabilis]KAI8378005.1 hypothetical protein BYT42DRAFT_497603 [Radiomyces spectabilis]
MVDTPSKSDAKMDKGIGNIKETAGSAVGNQSLENKGKAQHGEGQTQETAANITGYVQGMANQASGAVKGAINSLTGNTTEETGNKAEKKKGEAQQSFYS